MHEMSLCESIRDIIEEQGRRNGFSTVSRVCLEIGSLAGVEVEALRFGFDVAMRGSIAESASLDIIEKKATAWCLPCGESVSVTSRVGACPKCGSAQLQVSGGEELRIKEMEVH